jgi:hypothetical protein
MLIRFYRSILEQQTMQTLLLQSEGEKIRLKEELEYVDKPHLIVEKLRELFKIVLNASSECCQALKAREKVLEGAYDEVQLKLEDDIRTNLMKIERARIKLDVSEVKLKN